MIVFFSSIGFYCQINAFVSRQIFSMKNMRLCMCGISSNENLNSKYYTENLSQCVRNGILLLWTWWTCTKKETKLRFQFCIFHFRNCFILIKVASTLGEINPPIHFIDAVDNIWISFWHTCCCAKSYFHSSFHLLLRSVFSLSSNKHRTHTNESPLAGKWFDLFSSFPLSSFLWYVVRCWHANENIAQSIRGKNANMLS